MKLDNYISDLLYRYECVIVPGFGGFITNETSAEVNHFTHTFYPPKKKITFNSQLINNDGLLANYIASVDEIPYQSALNFISFEIEAWQEKLINNELKLNGVGSLSLNKDKKIIFEPLSSVNYLTSSFGLTSFSSPAIKRLEYTEKVRQLEVVSPVVITSERERRKTPLFLKYAATAAILFAVGSFGWNEYNKNQYQNQLLAEQQQQNEVEHKIQQATFVITNPLPAITINVVKKSKNYHIIAGAFREPLNANKKVSQLIKNGYDAQVIGVNKWNLTQVSYGSFSDKYDALKNLRIIKRTVSSDAWLLVKEF